MPVDIDVTIPTRQWDVEDVNKFNKLPYYFAAMQARRASQWTIWQKLYGTMPWTPKQGTTLRGVAQEPSPIVRQQFSPKAITEAAQKDIITTDERTSDALVQRHKFESPQFHFLPEFQDYLSHIQFNQKDIDRQILHANEVFYRTHALHKAPLMITIGNGDELAAVPYQTGIPQIDGGSDGKTQAFWQDQISKLPTEGGNFDLRAMHRVLQYLSEDVAADPFDRLANVAPKDAPVPGRYVLVGENSLYSNLIFDNEATALMSADDNFLTNQFTGSLFKKLNFMSERWPLRLKEDGTFPEPEIPLSDDAGGDAHNQTIPNPEYTKAPIGIAWACGANAYKGISIGAPPAAFAGGIPGGSKWNKLNWNGRCRLTDNVLINFGSNQYDTNKYGEVQQFIADAVFASLATTSRFCIPILYRRNRMGANSN